MRSCQRIAPRIHERSCIRRLSLPLVITTVQKTTEYVERLGLYRLRIKVFLSPNESNMTTTVFASPASISERFQFGNSAKGRLIKDNNFIAVYVH